MKRLALVSVFVLPLAAAPAAHAGAYPGRNGPIAFERDGELWVAAPGRKPRRLALPDRMTAAEPQLSPDGRRIAFAAGGRRVRPQIAVLTLRGRRSAVESPTLRHRRRRYTDVGAPTWSPDGRRLDFHCRTRRGFASEICAVRADGRRWRRLTRCDCVHEDDPGLAWSRRNRIAFVHRNLDVYSIAGRGGRRHRHTRGGDAFYLNPTWSPNGRRLAYETSDGDIHVQPSGRFRPRPVLDAGRRDRSGRTAFHEPSWSPDGKRLVVRVSRAPLGPYREGLYTTPVAGGRLRRLTVNEAGHGDRDPDWGPRRKRR